MMPQTVEEWLEYVDSLSPEDLLLKAIGANELVFVKTLQEEGFGPADIGKILTAFATALVAQELPLPNMPDQYLEYKTLLPEVI